ncbi:Microtubule-associated protein 1B [Balamuthia mandrillaris]
MVEAFVCEHHFCRNQKGEQKPRFSSRSNKTQHERGLGLHPCTVANCGCCRELERTQKTRTGKVRVLPFPCRHKDSCLAKYSSEAARSTHELHEVHYCKAELGCERCKKAQEIKAEQKEEERKRKREEEQRQRDKEEAEAHVRKMQKLTTEMAENWETEVKEMSNLPEREVQKRQAETLLKKLYEKETLGECLVALIQEDRLLIQYLVDGLPGMKEFLEQ